MSSFDQAGRPRPVRVTVGSVAFDPLTLTEAVTHVRDAIAQGSGGRLAVVDADLHRAADREPFLRSVLDEATLVLAGSASAVWVSRLTGPGLPQRVPAASLAEALSSACAIDGRRIYLIGGRPGGRGVPGGAQRAAAVLGLRHRGLRVAGCASPPAGFDTDRIAWADVIDDVLEAKPDLVFVGPAGDAGEKIVGVLRPELPGAWVFGWVGLVDSVLSAPSPWPRGAPAEVVQAARLLTRAVTARLAGRRRPGRQL